MSAARFKLFQDSEISEPTFGHGSEVRSGLAVLIFLAPGKFYGGVVANASLHKEQCATIIRVVLVVNTV